jgi:hypothetical protein
MERMTNHKLTIPVGHSGPIKASTWPDAKVGDRLTITDTGITFRVTELLDNDEVLLERDTTRGGGQPPS